MKRHAIATGRNIMELRRVLKFNGSMGLTLPSKFAKALDLHWKDYVEIAFIEPDKLVVRKHKKEEDWPTQHFV